MATKILTTHVGSLPRPVEMVPIVRGEAPEPADWDVQLKTATANVFTKQLDAGIDIINDGELGRRDYVAAARNRLSGFGQKMRAVGAKDLEESGEFADRFKGRKGLLTLEKDTLVENDACDGEIAYTAEGLKGLDAEIQRVVESVKAHPGKDGKKPSTDSVFFSSPSPGTITTFFANTGSYYPDHESYMRALGKAMKTEYERIIAAGLTLQVDCPDLAMGRHTKFKDQTLEEFQKTAALHVEVLNEALANIPKEKVRVHVCWGNYPGPHDADVPFGDIAEITFRLKAKYLSIEACNPGHAHEWKVFEKVKFPEGMVLMPGVLDTTTCHIEHPELVAQRLLNYIRLLGVDSVIASTDCGFSTAAGAVNVPEVLVWRKMRSMVEGAQIAAREASPAVPQPLSSGGYPSKTVTAAENENQPEAIKGA